MKSFILAITLALASSSAYASCTTHNIMTSDGRFIMCQTCCYGGNCNTICF
jgi:hypothetical protein